MSGNGNRLVSLRACARALMISHVALIKARDAGRCAPEQGTDGLWDIEKTRAALKQNSHPVNSRAGRSQSKRPPDYEERLPAALPAENSLSEANRQEAWEKYRARKLANDEKEGRLVDLPTINAFVAGMIVEARNQLLRIGPELRDDLAKFDDPVAIQAKIDERVLRALSVMGEYRPAERANVAA